MMCAERSIWSGLMKKISLSEESYWKLIELKSKFRCTTWKDLVDVIHRKCTND
jgi:hypothetical protein